MTHSVFVCCSAAESQTPLVHGQCRKCACRRRPACLPACLAPQGAIQKIHLLSDRKPTVPLSFERTMEMMMASFSRPAVEFQSC